MRKDYVNLWIRIPQDLKTWITEKAHEHDRSIASEACDLLVAQKYLHDMVPAGPASARARVPARSTTAPCPLTEEDWPGLRTLIMDFHLPMQALDDNGWWNLTSHACNGLSIALLDREFGKVAAYLAENPRKSPTMRGWKRFLRTWLERATEYERRHHGRA